MLNGLMIVLQWLGGVAWSVVWMTLAIVVSLVTMNSEIALAMARRIWSPGILRMARARVLLESLPEIDWTQPHIYVMNHQSTMDIPVAFAVLPANLRFVAKHTLRQVPFLGWYMRMTGMIFINRSSRERAVDSMRRAGALIRAGASILAFPEGTRSRDGKIHALKKGVFVLALEAQVPIVPVAIEGSGEILSAGGWSFRPGTIRVKAGQPIPTAGRGADQRDALIREGFQAMVQLHTEIGGRGGAGDAIAPAGPEHDEALDTAHA